MEGHISSAWAEADRYSDAPLLWKRDICFLHVPICLKLFRMQYIKTLKKKHTKGNTAIAVRPFFSLIITHPGFVPQHHRERRC